MSTRPDASSEEDASPGHAAGEENANPIGGTHLADAGPPNLERHPGAYLPPDTFDEAGHTPSELISVAQTTGDEPEASSGAMPLNENAIGELPVETSGQDLFEHYEYAPPTPPPRRKPDLADFVLFIMVAIAGFFCSGLLMLAAIHYRLFGVSTFKQANDDIHYRIGSQAAWYIITLLFCLIVFRLAWRRSFFEGLQWRAATAASRIWRLVGAASACFVAAIVDELVIPGPTNAPIDQTFRMPGAVWLLFAFGVTLAPLIEEIAYRGLLLPALCTAYDWAAERFRHVQPLPLGEDRFPQWSKAAMIFGSVVVSVPFALMHGEQTAYSMGPFLLLVCISLALCWVRLAVRSLAASVLVHSSYNLLLFLLMFLGTGGFKHLDRM